ncbi:MAG: TorF family putative porin, partial [Pseudomonadota bacterium]
MLKKNLLVAALASAFAMPAMAEDLTFSSNVTLTSNYLYRGISQTGNKAAIQGGFDLAHASGVYAGAWASSISWLSDAGTGIANAGTEIDTYVGYAGAAGDIGYDVGFLRYNYPGDYGGNLSADTNELYGKVSYKWVYFKYSRSTGNLFGVPDSSGSGYMDL